MATRSDAAIAAPTAVPPPDDADRVESRDGMAEELAFAKGMNLRERRTRRKLNRILREDQVQSHLHRIVVAGLYLLAGSAALMFLMLIWHLITPWRVLTEAQLADLKQLLFSGAVGAGASGLAKKYLALNSDDGDEA
ncbi:hypothetical protein ACFSC3_05180 [Sphingomonas floccifaciens]|uniref:Holin-X, holin superfamily III n=1 Tax=Sphingomonas floccifaciens TaxID=1844115 RepID=A0ABW4N9Y1_9SPHN